MTETIALDIGGVCLELCLGKALEALKINHEDGIPIEFAAVTDMLERGAITTDEWLNIFYYLFDKKFSRDELREAWSMIVGRDIDGMAELAKQLINAGYRLVFFSDTSEIHMQEVYRKLSFANLATGSVLSYETGFKKPDERMYKAFEAKYGKPVFYVDDRQDNIESGRRCGWNSHLFRSAAEMRKELVESGIL